MGASHKKKEPILREPEGTFAPQTSAAGGRLTRRFDLRYFKAAKQALTPDQFQKILQGLYGIALEDEDSLNRIAASKALLQTFLPKDWHAQWALALEEAENDQAPDARPIPKLLDAVEEVVIRARKRRGGGPSAQPA